MAFNGTSFYLYKRSNKIYYIGHYSNGKLKWKSTGCRSRPQAQRVLTQFKELMRGGCEIVNLGEFIERFMAYSEANHARKTIKLFQSSLRQFLGLTKDISIREIYSIITSQSIFIKNTPLTQSVD